MAIHLHIGCNLEFNQNSWELSFILAVPQNSEYSVSKKKGNPGLTPNFPKIEKRYNKTDFSAW